MHTRSELGQLVQGADLLGELLAAVDAAGGVGWRAEDDEAGALGQSGTQLLGSNLEILLDGGGNENVLALGEMHHLNVAHPSRSGNDNFVAGVDN